MVDDIVEVKNILKNVLPERIVVKYGDFTDEDYAYAEGWNDCIEEIENRIKSLVGDEDEH